MIQLRRLDTSSEGANVGAGNDVTHSAVSGHVGEEDFSSVAGLRQCQCQRSRGIPMRGQRKPRRARQVHHGAAAHLVSPVETTRTKERERIVEVHGVVDEVLILRLRIKSRQCVRDDQV